MTPETVKNFWINGYAIFHDIYEADTLNVLKDEMAKIIDNYDINAEAVEEFETKNNNRADFFLRSAW